jgi:hypothetical protein
VATVVVQLVAEGKLGLDDAVERRLPGLVPSGGGITIRELLDHTSGLYNYTDDDGFRTRLRADPAYSWPPRELLALATAHAPLFAPGKSWAAALESQSRNTPRGGTRRADRSDTERSTESSGDGFGDRERARSSLTSQPRAAPQGLLRDNAGTVGSPPCYV